MAEGVGGCLSQAHSQECSEESSSDGASHWRCKTQSKSTAELSLPPAGTHTQLDVKVHWK